MTELQPGWPYGRVRAPVDWRAERGGPGYPPGHPRPERHVECRRCGGYVQGTREATGECVNCAEGRPSTTKSRAAVLADLRGEVRGR